MEPVMGMAKVTSKGQVTIPQAIRSVLGVEKGDKVVFTADRDGRVTMQKASLLQALDELRAAFEGVAEEAGLETDEDIMEMIREMRYGKADTRDTHDD